MFNKQSQELTVAFEKELDELIKQEQKALLAGDKLGKFQPGDKARVCANVGDYRDDFLKHFLEIGKEVEIAQKYDGWKRMGHEAYHIKGNSEIFLAEELEKI